MIRWYAALALLMGAIFLFGVAQSLRRFLSAPQSGFDRAGGPGNGHPARERQPRGAAPAGDMTPGKDDNGAPHIVGATR